MRDSPSLKFKFIQELQSIITDYSFVDIWRTKNPNLCPLTWKRTNPVIMRRLDFVLVSNELQYDVNSCKQLTQCDQPVQSDHSPIVSRISSISEQTRGRGYWKFNSSLTEDKDCIEKLRTYIDDVKSTFHELQDPRTNWEFLEQWIEEFV